MDPLQNIQTRLGRFAETVLVGFDKPFAFLWNCPTVRATLRISKHVIQPVDEMFRNGMFENFCLFMDFFSCVAKFFQQKYFDQAVLAVEIRDQLRS